ncbi:TIGR03620 family F420-dependent LLM class oxidoreductase [Frankia sp. AiPs1]|uniref:TIGR03620 family F420-dependent LLM class oxidoreductase n=1 Tax=Frankia sp. AiPs1 TaxID=573493 RepID=UPI002042CA07|nr:TIGR03620 family F420-dependent LLM class oxidoreductase [Frankia sp. AiPs1]MCM3925578.1 TIGR03620 family F420-dependent LLM class oxidoreductase [Frankia sp. AiPs1]
MAVLLGQVGVWSPSFAWTEPDALAAAAAELDTLGYGALWIGAAPADLALPEQVLAASSRLAVATGIVNVWTTEPAPLAAAYHRLNTAYPDRFLLGLGISHARVVEGLGREYTRPLAHLGQFLDGLDGADDPVPAQARVLAALRPRALELSARRARGAHPYLVTPEYTVAARAALGDGVLLAPDQKVVLATDPGAARELARSNLGYYLTMPNYVANLQALGFDADDVAGSGSDRLVDALYAWGTPAQAAQRVRDHLDAGADHVAVQVISADVNLAARTGRPTVEEWRALAAELL